MNGTRRRLGLALGIVILMTGALSVQAERIEEPFVRTVAVDSGSRVIVDNENGSVTVESWDRNEVKIEATRYVEAGSREAAETAMSQLKVEVTEGTDTLEVRTVSPRRSDGGFWGWMTGNNVNSGVTYRVTVPRNANLDIDTVNGRVVVREVSGEMDLESTNGRIEVHDASGRVDASTTNGRIYAQLRSVKGGGMRFSTTNGSVELELPESVAASLEASTTNGSIKTDFPITISGTFSKNRLSGVINGGGEPLRIRTTNGSIRIHKING